MVHCILVLVLSRFYKPKLHKYRPDPYADKKVRIGC
jgi:hypothetical protein